MKKSSVDLLKAGLVFGTIVELRLLEESYKIYDILSIYMIKTVSFHNY